MVAISTDDLSGAKSIVGRVGISFPILYNREGNVVRDYGVYNLLGDGLAAPATFVIDTHGVVRWSYIGRGISDRPSAAKVIGELQRLES